MTYKCQYFEIYELVDKEVYDKWGKFAWSFLDARALKVIDHLREVHGAATINDWYWGGGFSQSGFRSPESKTGAKLSQHRFGRGFDLKFKEISDHDVRKWLEKNWTVEYVKKHFGCEISITIEIGINGWVHIDVRNNEKIFNTFSV